MNNNIIIAGVPRAGKSTVSHLLSKKFGYQHVSMDSIIAGFEKCFPETGVSTYQGLSSMDTLRVTSGKMAPFLRAMRDSFQWVDETVNLFNDFGDSFYFTTESGFPSNGGLVLFENTYDGHKGLCYQVCT